jgi:hypothetical protein
MYLELEHFAVLQKQPLESDYLGATVTTVTENRVSWPFSMS